jgi:catechol 2,3-dioxygenase-like lactoylglutathione lyase family enzyme
MGGLARFAGAVVLVCTGVFCLAAALEGAFSSPPEQSIADVVGTIMATLILLSVGACAAVGAWKIFPRPVESPELLTPNVIRARTTPAAAEAADVGYADFGADVNDDDAGAEPDAYEDQEGVMLRADPEAATGAARALALRDGDGSTAAYRRRERRWTVASMVALGFFVWVVGGYLFEVAPALLGLILATVGLSMILAYFGILRQN